MTHPDAEPVKESADAIRQWLTEYLGRLVGIASKAIDTRRPFADYGVDSTASAGLSGDLSDWLGVHLDPNLAKEYQTIEAIVEHLTATPLKRRGSI